MSYSIRLSSGRLEFGETLAVYDIRIGSITDPLVIPIT